MSRTSGAMGGISTATLTRKLAAINAAAPPLPVGIWGVAGDSRSLPFNSGSRDSRYLHTWLEDMLGGAIGIRKANVHSLGGITSTTHVTDPAYLTALLAGNTVGSIVMISANDILGNVDEETTRDNLSTVARRHRLLRRPLILLNEYPFQVWTDEQKARHLRVRDHIDSLHDPVGGIVVANVWDAMTTTPRGFVTRDGYLRADATHPTPRGAAAMARAVADAVRSAFTGFTPLHGRPAPLYAPASWSGWSTPSGTGITVVDDVMAGVPLRRIILDRVTGTTGQMLTMTGPAVLPTGFTPGTSRIDSIAGVKVLAGSSGIGAVALSTYYASGSNLAADEGGTAAAGLDGGSAGREYFPTIEVDMILHPPLGTLPVAATRVQQVLTVYGRNTGELISGEIQFWAPQLRAF